jgi:DNA-binding transcriptional LysR family regulator
MQAQLSHKFSPDRINYCDNIQTFLTLIRAGFGIGLLPEIPSAADVAFVPVDSGAFLSYGVFYRIAAVNPVTEKFLSLLKIK